MPKLVPRSLVEVTDAVPLRGGGGAAGRLFARLAAVLAVRAELLVERRRDGLDILPKGGDGFVISMRLLDGGCFVDIGGCEQEFDDVASAGIWVMRAVSCDYRLRIDFVADLPRCWTLEPVDAAAGGVSLASGTPTFLDHILRPFGRRRVIYRSFGKASRWATVH